MSPSRHQSIFKIAWNCLGEFQPYNRGFIGDTSPTTELKDIRLIDRI